MLAIVINTLYTTLRKRGTTRQLSVAIVVCVISALLLLPALVWYNGRFLVAQSTISSAEVTLALVYVALCGWFLPLSTTAAYCLFTAPRLSSQSVELPGLASPAASKSTIQLTPRRSLPGVQNPYVFGDDIPWGWLEYRGGRFQGQRLALKRSVISIGRDEDNDIWLDDDMASRHHAELYWEQGNVYLTDCDSMNGVQVNGKRIQGTVPVAAGDVLEIGSHQFLFDRAAQEETTPDDDPLQHHVWTPVDAFGSTSSVVAAIDPFAEKEGISTTPPSLFNESSQKTKNTEEMQDTARINPALPLPQKVQAKTAFVLHDGELAGHYFLVDRSVLTVGRDSEALIVINDASISRKHAQILHQANGVYIQDLGSSNGTMVNNQLLSAPHLLEQGDMITLGSIHLEYMAVEKARSVALPLAVPPPTSLSGITSDSNPVPQVRLNSGPTPLRLPSRPRNV